MDLIDALIDMLSTCEGGGLVYSDVRAKKLSQLKSALLDLLREDITEAARIAATDEMDRIYKDLEEKFPEQFSFKDE